MKSIHSIWALLVVITLLAAVIRYASGSFQKRQYSHKEFRIGLISFILLHIQFIIGFLAYFAGSWYKSFDMKSAPLRLITLEHPLLMIISIVLVTIGWSKHKKKTKSSDKFKILTIFYSIALLLVLSRIPWSNWVSTWF